MQTFVPSTDFSECARVLDRQRLGKQRVECGQILTALFSMRITQDDVFSVPLGWARHPATLMWQGYESALGVYMTFVCAEWVVRGYVNNMVTPYSRTTFLRSEGFPGKEWLAADGRDAELPPWWGDERVHSSHRNALLYKNQEHYRQFQWGGIPELNYFWPVTSDKEWTPEPVHPGHMYGNLMQRRKKSV